MELPVLKVPESRREAFADQNEQSKVMIAGAAGVGEVFLDVERSVLVEQPIEHTSRKATPIRRSPIISELRSTRR